MTMTLRTARHEARQSIKLLITALFVLAIPAQARAQQGTCEEVHPAHKHLTSEPREYRINIPSFDLLEGDPNASPPVPAVGRGPGENAVAIAAETWNHQTNVGYFVRGANTSLTELPPQKSGPGGCDALGIDYSLVVVHETDDWTPTADGRAIARCKETINGEEVATQFEIRLHQRRTPQDPPVRWLVGDVDGSVAGTGAQTPRDVAGTLVHEFGHTLNIDHPTNQEGSTMRLLPNSNTSRFRDLYSYDLKCAHELAEHRSLRAKLRYQFPEGDLDIPTSFMGSTDVAKVGAAYTWHTGSLNTAAALKKPDCPAWTRYFSTANTNCLTYDDRSSIGPTESTWREDESIDRVIYVDWEEDPMWDNLGLHRARYQRSTNGFASRINGSLSFCGSMSGWMQCASGAIEPLFTGKAMAFAWDNFTDRTVSAWARQSRDDSAQDRELLVSIGYILHTRLPEPDSLGVRTSIPPAVACNAYSAGSYDCVVAFTGHGDAYNRVRTRRFWAQAQTDRYQLVQDSNTHLVAGGARTAAPVALWFREGKFYLLLRNERPNNPLDLWESSDGASWSVVETLSDTGISLSAASYLQDTPYVLYAR